MSGKTIRSHRERVKQANETIKRNPRYKKERISLIDREAFVEFYLLEDILKLYTNRLKEEQSYKPQGRADQKCREINIEKFSAIINVFNAAIGAARGAINSGDYKKVWRAIPERALMISANSVKRLPELKKLAIEMLLELSSDMMEAVEVNVDLEEGLDDLDAHEQNVRAVKDIPSTMDQIEEVIKTAETFIPDRRKMSKLDFNT